MTWRDRLGTPAGRGLAVGLVAFALYLLTRTRDFGGDDTVYALVVDRLLAGLGASGELWHPHHPLFNPLVAAVGFALRSLGFEVLTLDVGAGVSAAFGALAVGGLAAVLTRSGLPPAVVWGAGFAAMVSGGLWGIATSMEVYALGAAGVLAWLAAMSREEPSGPAVGAALAAAILTHAVLGLLVVPTAVLLRRRSRTLCHALLLGLGGSGLVMAAVLALAHGATTPAAMVQAMVGGAMGSYLATPSPLAVLAALRREVAWEWFSSLALFTPGATRLLTVLGSAAAVVLGALATWGGVAAVRSGSRLGLAALGGTAAFVPLWLIWDAGNVEHVVSATPLLGALVALGAAALPRLRPRTVLTGTVATLAAVNALGSAVPHARAELSRTLVIATFVASSVAADDVVASTGSDARMRLSLPYLSGRRVVDLTLFVAGARARGLPAEGGLDAWLDELATAGTVVLLPDVLDRGAEAWAGELGIPAAAWRKALARLRPVSRKALPANGVTVTSPFTLTLAAVSPALAATGVVAPVVCVGEMLVAMQVSPPPPGPTASAETRPRTTSKVVPASVAPAAPVDLS